MIEKDIKSNEEQRRDILKADAAKDVNFNLAVFIATLASLSSGAAVLAVLSAKFLSSSRGDVEHVWMSCLPFCFTFITGVAMAYRKHLADVGIHIALAMTTLLAGGAGYGLSVVPVYINRHNCTLPHGKEGDCNREVLTMLYFFSGAAASGLGVLSFLASLCACSSAMKRKAKRERIRLLLLEHEDKKAKGQAREDRSSYLAPPTASLFGNGQQNNGYSPSTNGPASTQKTTKSILSTTTLHEIKEEPPVTPTPPTTPVTCGESGNVSKKDCEVENSSLKIKTPVDEQKSTQQEKGVSIDSENNKTDTKDKGCESVNQKDNDTATNIMTHL